MASSQYFLDISEIIGQDPFSRKRAIQNFTGNPGEIPATNGEGVLNLSILDPGVDNDVWEVGRAGNNQPNQFLRRGDRQPTNISPFIAHRDITLYQALAWHRANDLGATWDFRIEIDGTNNTTLVTLPTTAVYGVSDISIDVNEGQSVALRMQAQSEAINHPAGMVFWRAR